MPVWGDSVLMIEESAKTSSSGKAFIYQIPQAWSPLKLNVAIC